MDKIKAEDLIKKIDEKIAELEKQENPNELLKKAMLKKNIITSLEDISEEKIEKMFKVIADEIKK